MATVPALPTTDMQAGLKKNRTRADLRKDLLVGLGAPTIKIEVTQDQIDQAINSALRQFWEYHKDGSFENYYQKTLTSQEAAQGWFLVPENIDSVIEIIPNGMGNASSNFANVEWQMQAAAVGSMMNISTGSEAGGVGGTVNGNTLVPQGGLGSLSFSDYMIAKQGMDTMRMMIGSDVKRFDFARFMRRVMLRFPVTEGQKICLRVSENVDPDKYPEICGELFDDETLKNLATAYIKVTWGGVLRKFGNIALPGGETLDGDTLVEEGNDEIGAIIIQMQDSQPTSFLVG